MGRPEKPVNTSLHWRGLLAQELRKIRSQYGVTYAEMHRRSITSATAFKRAASGEIVARWSTVVEFLRACCWGEQRDYNYAISYHHLYLLWAKARMEERGTLGIRPPRPEHVVDAAGLRRALYSLYEHAGAPPLRDVQERGGGRLYLPMSTLSRIVKPQSQALPVDQRQFVAFLRGCFVPSTHETRWLEAWDKITTMRNSCPKKVSEFYLDPYRIELKALSPDS
jgi:hypothetical protein